MKVKVLRKSVPHREGYNLNFIWAIYNVGGYYNFLIRANEDRRIAVFIYLYPSVCLSFCLSVQPYLETLRVKKLKKSQYFTGIHFISKFSHVCLAIIDENRNPSILLMQDSSFLINEKTNYKCANDF